MAVDIVMPQMGESIFEGTITKWLKKPGDKVERDEPLFEISTDKVDAEIPAPATGVLTLSGTASPADYQDVLRSVSYSNTNPTPTIGTRTINFVVNDGLVDSLTASRNVGVVIPK